MTDPVAAISDLLDKFIRNSQVTYFKEANATIDDMLVVFR